MMMIADVNKQAMSKEDLAKVFGRWHWSDEYGCYISYRFGSA